MVGTTVQPPEDLITVFTDTFRLKAQTVRMDSIFAKATNCMLGEMYDPVYGTIKADFLFQMYCEEGFRFSETPYEGKIDSTALFIMYPASSWYGDSLTPMQATVYRVKPGVLKRNFYTNDNPELYCDMSNPLATKVYTAHDQTISDSIRAITDSYDVNYYTPNIRIQMPVSFGQSFYDEMVNNPASFDTQKAFNEFFPGLYITTTFGSGNLIRTTGEYLFLRFYYRYAETDVEGNDSIVSRTQDFTVSKEVIQLNRLTNSNLEPLLEYHPDYTYIKSPAGVCTRLTLPASEFSRQPDLINRYINGLTLKLRYLPEDERLYNYFPPEYLLLLPEDSVKSFFENIKVEDNSTSFISYDGNSYSSATTSPIGYSSYARTYYFGNISPLLQNHLANNPDEDLNMMLIPVTRTVSASSSSYYSTSSSYYTTAIANSFDLAGVKIRTEDEYMKVVVLSSKFDNR
jgi:hypothetical protein